MFNSQVLVGRGVSAFYSGIASVASRMDAAVDRARKDDGGFGAQAAMISGGLVAIGIVLVLALRDTGDAATDVLDAADAQLGAADLTKTAF